MAYLVGTLFIAPGGGGVDVVYMQRFPHVSTPGRDTSGPYGINGLLSGISGVNSWSTMDAPHA